MLAHLVSVKHYLNVACNQHAPRFPAWLGTDPQEVESWNVPAAVFGAMDRAQGLVSP
jgi:hypothetical protein